MELKDFLELVDPVKFKAQVESLALQKKNLDEALRAYGKVDEIDRNHKKSVATLAKAEKDAESILKKAEDAAAALVSAGKQANDQAEAERSDAVALTAELKAGKQVVKALEIELKASLKAAGKAEDAAQADRAEAAATLVELNERLAKLRSVMQ